MRLAANEPELSQALPALGAPDPRQPALRPRYVMGAGVALLVTFVTGCTASHARGGDAGADGARPRDAGPSIPAECAGDAHCAPAGVCVLGRCVPVAETCWVNLDCGIGMSCVDSACVQPCTEPDDVACADSSVCDGGYCTERIERPEPCDAAVDCAAGWFCERGVCRLDVRPRCLCLSDDVCPAGSVCRYCACVAACESDPECTRVDPTPGVVCGRDGRCTHTSREYAECRRGADCAVGRCIDGACR